MMRSLYLMQIKPGMTAGYLKRHNPIWPELKETLLKYGLRNYCIVMHEPAHQLLAFNEGAVEDMV